MHRNYRELFGKVFTNPEQNKNIKCSESQVDWGKPIRWKEFAKEPSLKVGMKG